MEIDLAKLSEIYGNNIISDINDELDNLVPNIEYLMKIGFENVGDIVELYPYLFLKENNDFVEKIESLIDKVGSNYINILNTNTDLWGYIDE